MNHSFRERTLQFLVFQRNAFFGLSVLLATALIVLTSFLFLKRERVVVCPAVVEREFWVDGQSVSPSYLEQMGCFLGQLLLGKSSQSAPMNRAILLRHTHSSFAPALRKRLVEEEDLLKKQYASYVFYPAEVSVNPKTLEVRLSGDKLVFISGGQASSSREEYTLAFEYSGGRLLLTGVKSGERSS